MEVCNVASIQGVPKKGISECPLMLNIEFSFLIHLKIKIQKFLLSTEPFLSDLRDSRNEYSNLTSYTFNFCVIFDHNNITQTNKYIVNKRTNVD